MHQKNKGHNKLRRLHALCSILLLIFYSQFTARAEAYGNKFQYTGEKKEITISKESLDKLIGFYTGNFYSEVWKKKITKSSGIYFALSEDGMNSVISYCEDDSIWNCSVDFAKYQSLKRCEKISKQKCFVIGNNREILINKESYKITRENTENDIKSIKNIKITNSNPNFLHSDIRYNTMEEKNNGESWDN